MSGPVFRTAYEREFDGGSEDPVVVCESEGVTKQEFKEECDINNIMSRYVQYGVPPDPAKGVASYGDFSSVGDFLDAQNRVLEARAAFESLPSAVRDRFNNDPARLIEFLHDEANTDEAVRLGLAVRPEPLSVPTVTPKEAPPIPATPPVDSKPAA